MTQELKQLELFDQVETPISEEEAMQERTIDGELRRGIQEKSIERENWGIRDVDLNKLDYRGLESIFYGMKNLEISPLMLDFLNPDEILAKYLAAGTVKRYNQHTHVAESNFLELIRELDRIGYRSSLRGVRAHALKVHPNEPGKQLERMNLLPEETKSTFLESFLAPYKPSIKEDPGNPDAYYDPNVDGESKRVYVQAILSRFHTISEKHRH
ncbi:MAG: hypothetical protein O2779_03960 [Nanoarchaeota archaeon]|nr:hypothetical protein [Nanoarchaeota archaeon]